jgi:hypothetical protein
MKKKIEYVRKKGKPVPSVKNYLSETKQERLKVINGNIFLISKILETLIF